MTESLLPLRCLESEVEEKDVYTLGNHNIFPSPKEVELRVGPACLVRLCPAVFV